jgi:CHASE3 domain sensor protein
MSGAEAGDAAEFAQESQSPRGSRSPGEAQSPGQQTVLIAPDGAPDGWAIAWRRRIMLAIIAVFTLLASACLIAGFLVWRDVQATDAVLDARQSRLAGSLLLEAVLNAETTQRGYMLTRDSAYLANYDDAKTTFARALVDLRDRSSAQMPWADLTTEIARLGVEKFAEMDRTIALAKAGQFDNALEIVRQGAGKASMDELRRAVGDLTARANFELTRTSAAQSWLGTLLVGAIVIVLICVAGLGCCC